MRHFKEHPKPKPLLGTTAALQGLAGALQAYCGLLGLLYSGEGLRPYQPLKICYVPMALQVVSRFGSECARPSHERYHALKKAQVRSSATETETLHPQAWKTLTTNGPLTFFCSLLKPRALNNVYSSFQLCFTTSVLKP